MWLYVTDPETGDLVPSWSSSFYFGYTAHTREIKGLGWLSFRDANQQAADSTYMYVNSRARNRQALLWIQGGVLSSGRSIIRRKAFFIDFLHITRNTTLLRNTSRGVTTLLVSASKRVAYMSHL